MPAFSLRLTLRQLGKNRLYALINIVGLAVGLAAALLIVLFVADETSHDGFHEKADRIYRVAWETDFGVSASVPLLPMDMAVTDVSGAEAGVNLYHARYIALTSQAGTFREDAFYYASNTFFDVFSFDLISGDETTALEAPGSVVLTEEAAQRYFSSLDVLGRELTSESGEVFTVTGILARPTGPSILSFDFLASFSTLTTDNPWQFGGPAFLLMEQSMDTQALSDDLNRVFTTDALGWGVEGMTFHAERLQDLHLRSKVLSMGRPSDALRYLYIFSGIALFLLITASVNYMNLATARALQRAREVGMRKSLGARKTQLLGQFMVEPLVLVVCAAAASIALMFAFLPTFNGLTGKELEASALLAPGTGGLFVLVALATGLLSGLYPAQYLSRFEPARVLKSDAGPRSGGSAIRKTLVVFQFTLSVVVVAATLIIQSQIDFLENKSLGYEEKDLVTIQLRGSTRTQWEDFKEAVGALSGVERVSAASGTPMEAMISMQDPEDGEGEPFRLFHYFGDVDYIPTMGYELVAGRSFSEDMGTDGQSAVVVNEATVRQFGLEGDPVGQQVGEKTIIGVVKDFHSTSLHSEISPALIGMEGMRKAFLIVRVRPDNIAGVLAGIEQLWQTRAPEYPFEYDFQDDKLTLQYSSEEKLASFFRLFSFLVIGIACLGLFGLASFTAQQRTKEHHFILCF